MDLIKDLDKLIESKIDRSKWQKWKFSDLVDNINEKVVPKDSGLDHYIGLEHLDSGSLHIRRFGETKSLIGDKLKIYKGDIIFAKRNAYLKRVAIAQFDAVASAHSLVLRARQNNVESDFLPFFLMSETFWTKAIEISVGSLSPTINWPMLAKQEFILPPKSQQFELLALFKSIEIQIESDKHVLDQTSRFKETYLKDLFQGKIRFKNNKSILKSTSLGEIPSDWDVKSVNEVARVIRGSSPRPKGDPRYYGGNVPRLMGEDVTRDGKYTTPKIDFLTEEGAKLSRPLPKGTLVMICSGNVGLSTFLAVDCCIHDGFIAFPELSSECDPDFLYYSFNSQLNRLFQNATHGGVFTNLTTDIVKNFEIVLPPIEEQRFIGKQIAEIDLLIKDCEGKLIASKNLQNQLINMIFRT